MGTSPDTPAATSVVYSEGGRLRLEYKLLNLGPSRLSWRNISHHPSAVRVLGRHQQPRIQGASLYNGGVVSPSVLDNVLYWMVDDYTRYEGSKPHYTCEEAILAFDTGREEFHLLPHPDPPCPHIDKCARSPKSMQLFEYKNNRGQAYLSLFRPSEDDDTLSYNIWIFRRLREEDNVNSSNISNGCWVKMHTIRHGNYEIIGPLPRHLSSNHIKPIAMANGDSLVVQLEKLGCLFVYNLTLGACEVFETTRGDEDMLPVEGRILGEFIQDMRSGDDSVMPVGGPFGAFICAYTHSLLPIRNPVPEILLLE